MGVQLRSLSSPEPLEDFEPPAKVRDDGGVPGRVCPPGVQGGVVPVAALRPDLVSLLEPERRLGPRLAVEMYLNAYVEDRPRRGVTLNISEQGLYLHTVLDTVPPPFSPIGLEFVLPGIRETIWAAGVVCFDQEDGYFLGQGIRFTAMAQLHARLLRHFCLQTSAGGGRPPDHR
jgi:hypothetical protein